MKVYATGHRNGSVVKVSSYSMSPLTACGKFAKLKPYTKEPMANSSDLDPVACTFVPSEPSTWTPIIVLIELAIVCTYEFIGIRDYTLVTR